MTNATMFEPFQLGSITLSNRIVMAPRITFYGGGAKGYTDYSTLAA